MKLPLYFLALNPISSLFFWSCFLFSSTPACRQSRCILTLEVMVKYKQNWHQQWKSSLLCPPLVLFLSRRVAEILQPALLWLRICILYRGYTALYWNLTWLTHTYMEHFYKGYFTNSSDFPWQYETRATLQWQEEEEWERWKGWGPNYSDEIWVHGTIPRLNMVHHKECFERERCDQIDTRSAQGWICH